LQLGLRNAAKGPRSLNGHFDERRLMHFIRFRSNCAAPLFLHSFMLLWIGDAIAASPPNDKGLR
jgi:hypothetical protein